MSRVLKFIGFLFCFMIFFEVGVVSSYTIVTSQPPDVGQLFQIQIDKLSQIVNSDNIKATLGPSPTELNMTNRDEVLDVLLNKTNATGIDLRTLKVTTLNDTEETREVYINITAMAYKDDTNYNTGSTIVIKETPQFIITATAIGNLTSGRVKVDLSSIKIVDVKNTLNRNNSNENNATSWSSSKKSKKYSKSYKSKKYSKSSYSSSSDSSSSDSGSSSGGSSSSGSSSSSSGSGSSSGGSSSSGSSSSSSGSGSSSGGSSSGGGSSSSSSSNN